MCILIWIFWVWFDHSRKVQYTRYQSSLSPTAIQESKSYREFSSPTRVEISQAITGLFIYHDGSNNVVQVCSFIKPWTVCSNIHEQACQQPCSSWPAQPGSSWPAQPCSSLSTGKDKLCILTCVYTSYFLLGLARWYDRLCEKTEIKESIRRVLWSRSNNHRRCRQSQATKGDVFIYIHCTLCLYLKPRLHPAITRPGLSSWLMRFIQK